MSFSNDVAKRRIIQAAANGVPVIQQQQGINPALHFFFPSYYQLLAAMVQNADAERLVETSNEQLANEAYSLAAAAFKRMGFDFVPRWEKTETGFALVEDRSDG